MASNAASQPVTFFTRTAYQLPSQKFMIPTSWKRYQLSQLINKALDLSKPVPFDFLIRGSILRNTLSSWCTENGVGEEDTLQIEYIESVMPPQKISDLPHDDWVSSVSLQLKDYILTSSYDGTIRFFDYAKKLRSTTLVHNAPITSACLISEDSSTYTIASSSHDLTARITQVTMSTDGVSSSKVLASLRLHTAPLSSIHSYGNRILTSSWDGLIGVWNSDIPHSDELLVDEENDRRKRRRVEGPKPIIKAPLNVLRSHTNRVSKAVFAPSGQTKAYSGGLDSTVRIWDTERGICERTIAASEKPFLDLAVTSNGNSILATSTDRTLSVYDLRSPNVSFNMSGSFTHSSTPSCVVVSDTNPCQVLTGAYDNTVRVWDLRSTKDPVVAFKVWDSLKKVLCVDWVGGLVGVGGEAGLDVWKIGDQVGK